MPWNNQNGGGGWKGGGGGPWGQGPQGGGSGGGGKNQPPDLEELLKRSQDKFKQAMPGGGSSLIWLAVIVIALIVWFVNSFHVLQPEERGVVLRFGKHIKTFEDGGLKFILWPMDELRRVKFKTENSEPFPRSTESVMLAGDQNLLDVSFTVFWKVKNSEDYLFKTARPDALVRVVADSAMREIAGRTPADQMRTRGRNRAQEQVKDIIQKTLDKYQAGIRIIGVSLQDVAPPEEVRDAFEDVQKAKQDQDKFIEEANRFANRRLGVAKGEVARQLEAAKAYKSRVVAEAQGEAKRFISVYEQYAKAKDVTRKRLYLETLQEVLSKSNKVIIEQGSGSGVVPYLPLPELQKRKGGS